MPGYSEGPDAEVARAFNMSSVATGLRDTVPLHSCNANTSSTQRRAAATTTTISCYHASVAQKSYGSEKRFLCPPPIVHIQGDLEDPNSGLTSRPQVAMSVICEAGENHTLGQRSTLEDDQSSTFRYLYPSKKTAKARNVSSCILAGSLVSLFNRINSQTVRTKYMSVMNGSLCAKSSTWSAFTISIVANGPS
ncbi:hypothetical protein BGZ70_005461, partial [Mortierella alpina]